jgi:membrane-bound lytic murein transglycosylase B
MVMNRYLIPAAITSICLLASSGAQADSAMDDVALSRLSGKAAFSQFLDDLRPRALKSGISASLYDRTVAGLTPDPRVKKLSRRQPEFNTPIWQYINKRVSPIRIATGRKMKAKHAARLAAIEARFGVDRHILLAIWGMETNYGSYKGKMSIIRSLATMGFEGRRARFGRTQLIAALKILQRGDVRANQFVGSWAGAMGHTQFIPTTYAAHAVDWTGDGKRDIWNSVSDALASTANYLSRSGWRPSRPWGWEVSLPKGFNYRNIGPSGRRSVLEWSKLGVRPARGGRFGLSKEKARILLPAGAKGPAFLVTRNFKAILSYNASNAYALAVAHLADRIRGGKPFLSKWPVGDRPLSRNERSELQKLLTRKGFNTGGANGRIGKNTKQAIRRYQASRGLAPDGYASENLLIRLRRNP